MCISTIDSLPQERLDEIEWISSSLTKILGANPALGMQQR